MTSSVWKCQGSPGRLGRSESEAMASVAAAGTSTCGKGLEVEGLLGNTPGASQGCPASEEEDEDVICSTEQGNQVRRLHIGGEENGTQASSWRRPGSIPRTRKVSSNGCSCRPSRVWWRIQALDSQSNQEWVVFFFYVRCFGSWGRFLSMRGVPGTDGWVSLSVCVSKRGQASFSVLSANNFSKLVFSINF